MKAGNIQNKAVILARVSSKAQEEEGYSLDAQQKLLRNYCADQQYRIVREFRVSETAAKNEQRTIFREMMTYLSTCSVAHLVVEKTDRLTRNFRDAIVVDDWLEANPQRQLHMVKEGLTIHKNSRSSERMMWNIFLSLAKGRVDNLREEAMKGWSEKLAQGWRPSAPPIGYKTAIENGKKIHVIDEDTAPLVERAFRLYLEPDQNIVSVTKEVAENGLSTRKGRPLGKTAVHKMLREPFYVGVIRFNGSEYPGAFEPLISRELFKAVQVKLENGYHEHRRTHNSLFKGELRCDSCGGVVTWQLQKGRYYGACQRHKDACKGRRLLREDRLENQLLLRIDEVDESHDGHKLLRSVMQLLEARERPYIGQHREVVMKAIRQRIRRAEQMEDNLYDDKLAGTVDEQRYAQKISELHRELAMLRSRLEILEASEAKRPQVEKPGSIRELYLRESKTGKRVIIHALFSMSMQGGTVCLDLKAK